jgi:hypothetical protein
MDLGGSSRHSLVTRIIKYLKKIEDLGFRIRTRCHGTVPPFLFGKLAKTHVVGKHPTTTTTKPFILKQVRVG